MRFFPVIGLCEAHAEELNKSLRTPAQPIEKLSTYRSSCDASTQTEDGSCREPASKWFYTELVIPVEKLSAAGKRAALAEA